MRFDTAGGTSVNDKYGHTGDTVAPLGEPTRTAYDFGGWDDTGVTGTLSGDSFIFGDSDAALTAKWNPIHYTVTFKDRGDVVEELEYTAETTNPEIPVPTEPYDGYQFDHWAIATENSDDHSWLKGENVTAASFGGPDSPKYGNVEAEAVWRAADYTLNYDLNGGGRVGDPAMDEPPAKGVKYDEAIGALGVPALPGYQFLGWFTLPEGGRQVDENTVYSKENFDDWSEGATIYAQWRPIEYAVAYNTDGGNDLIETKYTIEGGSLSETSKSGFDFVEWQVTEADEGGNVKTGDTFPANADLSGKYGGFTVKAVWAPKTVSLKYDLNDGEKVKIDGEGAKCPASSKDNLTYGEALGELENPTLAGYAFEGWFTDPAGGVLVNSETLFNAENLPSYDDSAKSAAVYARWSPVEYVATFDPDPGVFSDDGDIDSHKITYTIESGFAFPDVDSVSREGYTLKDWVANTTDGNWSSDSLVPGSLSPSPRYGNVNFKAYYGDGNQYKVAFNVNDENYIGKGSSTAANDILTYDKEISGLPTAARTGYAFDGWYRNADRADKGQKISDGDIYAVADNITLYAHFTPIDYKITFDTDLGEEIPVLDFTIETDVNLPEATKTGYVFDSWVNLDDTQNGTWRKNASFKAGSIGDSHWGDVTLTASYNPKYFNVTWVISEDPEIKDVTQVVFDGNPVHDDPSYQTDEYIYAFVKWTPDLSPVKGDVTYTAIFDKTPRSYSLKWVDGNGETLNEETVEFGSPVDPDKYGEPPARKGYTVQWDCPYDVMPAMDFTIKPKYAPIQYSVKWYDYDGTTLLEEDKVDYDSIPEYNGEEKTRPTDDMYDYSWSGKWNPAVAPVTGDAEYTAVYDKTPVNYHIKFLADADGDGREETVKEYDLGYGLNITDIPDVPDNADGLHGYWADLPAAMPVGGIEVHAQYVENGRQVEWVIDGDSGLSYKTVVTDGDAPSYPYPAPEKAPDSKYTYTFKGWSQTPDGEVLDVLPEAFADVKYYAVYDKTPVEYSVRWVVDGRTVRTETVPYGEPIPEEAIPSKTGYTAKWDYEESVMPDRDLVLTAVYEPVIYTITWVLGDSTETTECAYGEVPSFTGSTDKAPTETTVYKFTGWDKEPEACAGDATYTAQYSESARKYKVQYVDGDQIIASFDVAWGEPIPEAQLPERYGYTAEWSEIPDVMPTNDVTITAIYTPKKYTVTWVTPSGRIKTEADYGTIPVYEGETPVKPSTAQKEYAFSGWFPAVAEVTGDAVYTAQFTEKYREYTVTYVVDGVTYKTYTVRFGDELPNPAIPEKTGYTAEWDTVYHTMPAQDLTVNAVYTPIKYTVRWLVDGAEIRKELLDYGSEIPEVPVPEKPGFKGRWDRTDTIVPASDIDFNAVYEAVSYTVSWSVGDDAGSKPINYGEEFSYTFSTKVFPDELSVKVGGKELPRNLYTYDAEIGHIIIPGDQITGDVHITEKSALGTFNVHINVSGAASSNGSAACKEGMAYHTDIVAPEGYLPPESVQVYVGGSLITSGYTYDPKSGKLTINGEVVTGDIEVRGVLVPDTNYVPPEDNQPGDENKPEEDTGNALLDALMRLLRNILTFFNRIFGIFKK